ncbi:MAG: hypothetical protein KDC04_04220 [Saprospiraceae bacterium]|nr:hypothetical protein [Saprospiraceae bacterium]
MNSFTLIGFSNLHNKSLKRITFLIFWPCLSMVKWISSPALPLPAKEIENYTIEFISKLLKNPIDTFNYYKDLESSKAQKKQYEQKLNELNKLIDQYDSTRELLREQNKRGIIGMNKLEEEIDRLDKQHRNNLQEQERLNTQLAPLIIIEGYDKVFKVFKEHYSKNLDEILQDRDRTQGLLRLIIKEIIVSSRPMTPKDIIAGKKKANQQIPHKLFIKLRLPREILSGFIREANTKAIDIGNIVDIMDSSSRQSDIYGAEGRT